MYLVPKIRGGCVKTDTPSFVRPACAYSNGCKSLTRPYSGKRPATDKGVHREVESEGSLRQISGLTHRNYI